jgi:microcompartment protein CcmL/EutN
MRASFFQDNSTALICAAIGGHVGAVKMLLECGASIDAIDNVKSFFEVYVITIPLLESSLVLTNAL